MTQSIDTPVPTAITLHQASNILEVRFGEDEVFRFSAEFLRVYSPSAEVRGHGPGQEVLQVGKRDVRITALEAVGVYAVQPTFSDGHDTGLYTWDYLYKLGCHQEALWQNYLDELAAKGGSRDPSAPGGAAPRPAAKH